MSKLDKLKKKLEEGRIDARELRSLFTKLGWYKSRQEGSHETWTNGDKKMTLATHDKDLKNYQVKLAQEALDEKNEV